VANEIFNIRKSRTVRKLLPSVFPGTLFMFHWTGYYGVTEAAQSHGDPKPKEAEKATTRWISGWICHWVSYQAGQGKRVDAVPGSEQRSLRIYAGLITICTGQARADQFPAWSLSPRCRCTSGMRRWFLLSGLLNDFLQIKWRYMIKKIIFGGETLLMAYNYNVLFQCLKASAQSGRSYDQPSKSLHWCRGLEI